MAAGRIDEQNDAMVACFVMFPDDGATLDDEWSSEEHDRRAERPPSERRIVALRADGAGDKQLPYTGGRHAGAEPLIIRQARRRRRE
jgi:hypothetical protein